MTTWQAKNGGKPPPAKNNSAKTMKFIFKNIGPVKKAELELGNLTIIAGRNNTGKSYIAHTLYNFLSRFHSRVFADRAADLFIKEVAGSKGADIYLKMKAQNRKIVVSKKDAEGFFKFAIKKLVKDFCEEFHVHFAAAASDFAGADFSCSGFVFPTNSKGYKPHLGKKIPTFSLADGRFEIAVQKGKRDQSDKTLAAQEILIFYMSQITNLPGIVFPAERMSVVIFQKELDYIRSRLLEATRNADEGKKRSFLLDLLLRFVSDPPGRYGKPTIDSMDFARNVEENQKRKSEFADGKLLEDFQNIVGGSYRYANNQILYLFKAKNGKQKAIPLHIASSSVQCFALLYFYLQHVAKKGQLLIIDEPEAHLDTANQIKLARLLARCANSGIKVVITTHSDYLVKEINNLIMFSYESEDKAELLKKFKYSESETLKKADVNAYVCEKGGLTRCDINGRGVAMPMFDDTMKSISRVSRTLNLYLPENA